MSSCIVSNCTPPEPPPEEPAPEPLFESASAVTYAAIGGAQRLTETYEAMGGRGELYTAGQEPLASNAVAIEYDPRDAVFTVSFAVGDINDSVRFQDPAHRTDFGPSITPQGNVPDLAAFNYLEAGLVATDSSDVQTFFYEEPGTTTRYVTLAGYVRNVLNGDPDDGDFTITRTRGATIFGNVSRLSDVPGKGTASYSGNLLASMVSIDLDPEPSLRSRFEWVSGTADLAVDFGNGTVSANFQGSVVPTQPVFEGPAFGDMSLPNVGATFSATGTASINGTGYVGKIDTSSFAGSDIDMAASSMDGAFFGPDAVETGGAFRVIGATPDTRVDIIGAFTGVR